MSKKEVILTKEWSDFDRSSYYPNLHKKNKAESVVDILLNNGLIASFCLLGYNKFICLDFRKNRPNRPRYGNGEYQFYDVNKIRLTHRNIMFNKNHFWADLDFCVRCGCKKIKPYPTNCGIATPFHNRELYPEYEIIKKPKLLFDKKDSSYLYPF